MKNYILFLLSSMLLVFGVSGQVGIKTVNPQNGGAVGVLHIDGAGNNNSTGTPTLAQTRDDLLINSLGRMSIGHISPTHMLHINTGGTLASPVSAIKIEDGSQGVTKLLTSDADGNSRWNYVGEILAVNGSLSSTGISPVINENPESFRYTGSYIDLPPGRWMVMVSMILFISGGTPSDITQRGWIRSTFCDSTSATDSSADLVPLKLRWISGLAYSTSPNLMNGFLIIYNSSASTKRYYYSLGASTGPANTRLDKFGGSSYRQNYILALKMKNN